MPRVLLVDDDKNVIEVIQMYLEDLGYDLTTFLQAEEALKWMNNNSVDLLITDLLMPEKSGLELIGEVKKAFPEVKIMAISGGGNSGGIVKAMALDKALDLGAENALGKPFSKEELIKRIDKLLK